MGKPGEKQKREEMIVQFARERAARRADAERQLADLETGEGRWRETIGEVASGLLLLFIAVPVAAWWGTASYLRKLFAAPPAMTTTLILPPRLGDTCYSWATRVGCRLGDGGMEMSEGLAAYNFDEGMWVRVDALFDKMSGIYPHAFPRINSAMMGSMVRGRLPTTPTHWVLAHKA